MRPVRRGASPRSHDYNTFTAFLYKPDGRIAPAQKLSNRQRRQAHACLALTGLDRKPANTLDANGQMIALDRGSQRMETWAIAAEARKDIAADPNNHPVKTQVIQLARAQGHFSIWMAVFDGDAELRNRLID